MSVKLNHLLLNPGDSIRLQCGERVYIVNAEQGDRLTFRHAGEKITYLFEDQRMRKIVEQACMNHSCSTAELIGRSTTPHLVRARSEVARELRKLGWSLPRIGRLMNKHHTSVLHMLRTGAERKSA